MTISLNCDRVDSSLLAFEKAGETALEILRCAQKHGIEVEIEDVENNIEQTN